MLFVDQGDIVLLDTVSGTRRQITRTTGAEANPRWARHETASPSRATTICSSCRSTAARSTQLTDVQPQKRDPRETDSQKFVKAEEQKLIEHTRVEAEKKKKAEEKDKARALPKFELADRQSATDLQLSPDDTHVFILVVERTETAQAAERPELRHRVELHRGHSRRAPSSATRRTSASLAVMNLETGKTRDRHRAAPQDDARTPRTRSSRVRWRCRCCQTTARWRLRTCAPANNKDRWLVARRSRDAARRASLDALHDDAWVREVGGGFGQRSVVRVAAGSASTCGSCPSATAGCTSTRVDATRRSARRRGS